MYPTVNQLPGGPFSPTPLQLTADQLNQPLAPGDYTINTLDFCSEYSVHEPGAGVAYVLGPYEGKAAGAIGALIWGYMYAPNLSPFNQILRAFHQTPIDFLSPDLVLFSIGNIVTWTWTGYNMITLFAALHNIPRELYEAARVDGATGWAIVRYIKIPLVIPTIRLLFIFSIIGTSQLFTEALVLRPLGYVADNITPNLYLYLTAARDANYSYAGALAILLAVLIFVLSGAFLRRVGSR